MKAMALDNTTVVFKAELKVANMPSFSDLEAGRQ